MTDLRLKGVLFKLPEKPVYPDWFFAGKNTPFTHCRNVARGRHPMGHELGPEESRCGTCKHVFVRQCSKTYFKCEKCRVTCGSATDIRLKWRGCALWEEK